MIYSIKQQRVYINSYWYTWFREEVVPTPQGPNYQRKDYTVRNAWIKHYFNRGYTYKDITLFLGTLHGFKLGIDMLKKALRQMGLKKRKERTEENMAAILRAVRTELEGSGK